MKKFTNPSMSTSQRQMSFHKVNQVLFNSLSDLKNSSFVVASLCVEYCGVEVERFSKPSSFLLRPSFSDVRIFLIHNWAIM